MLNLTRLHLGIAHESQFQGLGIISRSALTSSDVRVITFYNAYTIPGPQDAEPIESWPLEPVNDRAPFVLHYRISYGGISRRIGTLVSH